MNDLYGIDPNAPCDLRDFNDLNKWFGPAEGRFIAEFPPDWLDALRAQSKPFGDIELAKVNVLLDRLKRFGLLPVQAHYNHSQPWHENAGSLQYETVKRIAARGTRENITVPIDTAFSHIDFFRDSREAMVPQTADDYIKTMRPILQTSPKVIFVDRFLAPGKPATQRFFTDVLKEAKKFRRVEVLVVWKTLEQGESRDRVKMDLCNAAIQADAKDIRTELRVITNQDKIDHHPRFFLGLESCLRFDQGFELHGGRRRTNHVSWVGPPVLEGILKKYASPKST